MTITASFCLNSTTYHGMKSSNLRGTTVGAIDRSRLHLATRNISSKLKMMLGEKQIPPNKVSDHSLGRMVDGFVFRQNFKIRTYEIGKDRTMSIETVMNLLQETCVNHIEKIGILGDGLAVTKEMCKKNLIWVMSKLLVAVERYPTWGDVVQIDTRKGFYRNIGMTSDWIFCDSKTGEIIIRASCVWLIMNSKTRKLSKFTNEILAELAPHFIDTPPMVNQDTRKWSKRDENMVDHACHGLAIKWSDLDINQHLNHAKYINWILESVPMEILENYELANMTLRYCRECRRDNVLQSRTFIMETDDSKIGDNDHVDCEHLLELDIGSGGDEILKGRTSWRLKYGKTIRTESNDKFVNGRF